MRFLSGLKTAALSLLPKHGRHGPEAPLQLQLHVHRAAPGTWVSGHLPASFAGFHSPEPVLETIETRARETNDVGALPLWDGYRELEDYPGDTSSSAVRSPNQVRTQRRTGEFYCWMVTSAGPSEIVEVGGAFGISGMYWCAGLRKNGFGNFTSFEPNAAWARHAAANIQSILAPARLVVGTFEDNLHEAPDRIDLAFIDAIHTPAFVEAQLALVLERARPGALIVLDDIYFSDPMAAYWKTVRDDPRFAAAFEMERRVGVLELAR